MATSLYGFPIMWQNYVVDSTILFAAKTSGKTRLVQYVITAKNLFKTSIYSLKVIIEFLKKNIP